MKRMVITWSSFLICMFFMYNALANTFESSINNYHSISPNMGDSIEVLSRYIAIDNVCAWPNLTLLPDGSLIATIFNRPSHGRHLGDVECWSSEDGQMWKKAGIPALHKGLTNRMNVAAGLTNTGELVVLASGWAVTGDPDLGEKISLTKVLRPWVSISKDGGKSWQVNETGFPKAEAGMTDFIPFGDVLVGKDGSLRTIGYAQSIDKAINKTSMFRSDDNGRNWTHMSKISTGSGESALAKGHNETALYHLGNGEWIAAARRWKAGSSMDLFRSTDDGQTWSIESELTQMREHPGHLTQLKDGKLLLTYGSRVKGKYGVAIKTSTDKGRTWSEEKMLFSQLEGADLGYPSSVQLSNGNIVTAYYASNVANHNRYHMGSITWTLK